MERVKENIDETPLSINIRGHAISIVLGLHNTVTIHLALPVGMIEENIMAEGSNCDVSQEAV